MVVADSQGEGRETEDDGLFDCLVDMAAAGSDAAARDTPVPEAETTALRKGVEASHRPGRTFGATDRRPASLTASKDPRGAEIERFSKLTITNRWIAISDLLHLVRVDC